MKEPVRLPFVFLFIFVCVIVVFSALDLCYVWGYSASDQPFSLAFLFQRLPRSAFQAIVPAVVTALVLTGFRMVRKPFSRFLGIAICLATSYITLVNGMLLLHRMIPTPRPAAETARHYIQSRSFQRIGDSLVLAQTVTENEVKGVLLYNDVEKAAGRFSVYPGGKVTAAGGSLSLRLSNGGSTTLTEKLTPAFAGVFAPDGFTRIFLRDIGVLNADLEKLLTGSLGEFFAACFSLLFLCVASMALLRLTRWPLINVLVYILAVRGCFFLYHLFAVDAGPEIAKIVADPLVVRILPSVVFSILGLVFLLIDILFIPTDRRKQVEAQ